MGIQPHFLFVFDAIRFDEMTPAIGKGSRPSLVRRRIVVLITERVRPFLCGSEQNIGVIAIDHFETERFQSFWYPWDGLFF